LSFSSFFFTVTASIEIYTLSLHDALPIFLRFCLSAPDDRWQRSHQPFSHQRPAASGWRLASALHRADLGDLTEAGSASVELRRGDRKSTRLNSSHVAISYAVFCLKKKKKS